MALHPIRSPGRATAALLALSLTASTAPHASASVTFFSDRYVEKIAAALKLPPGGPDAPMPPTREARLAELEATLVKQGGAFRRMRPAEGVLRETAAPFREALRAVQALVLSPAEREALASSGPGALSPEKQAILEDAAAPAAEMRSAMGTYFAAYDDFQQASIHGRILGMALDVLHRREQLEGELSRRAARKLDERIGRYLEGEHVYRRFRVHPAAKNHHRILATLVCQRRLLSLDDELDDEFRKLGRLPKRTFRQRLRSFGDSLKVSARVARAGLAALPGVARALGYLYNPFRKDPAPGKVAEILRKVSRGYQKATGMRLSIEGAEGLPTVPTVFAFSHRSEVEDAMLMFGATPGEYAFMVGQWALPGFLNDQLVQEPSIINVNGRNPDGSEVDAIEEGLKNLRAGRNLVIFPEGMTPSDQGETQPLRRGLDILAEEMGAEPLAIVAVTLDDPANDSTGLPHRSLEGDLEVKITFSQAIDPLKLKAVPGADAQLLLDLVRATWHARLYDLDVGLLPAG